MIKLDGINDHNTERVLLMSTTPRTIGLALITDECFSHLRAPVLSVSPEFELALATSTKVFF